METAALAGEPARYAIATLAGGCFWCTEAVFKRLKGVESVMSGYSGGKRANPNYEQVHSDATGHAEAIQIKYDPKVLTFEKLLEVFFKLHDPTTPNQQGADIGSEYRSVIFYHNEDQRKKAEKIIAGLENNTVYQNKIVTELLPFEKFYPAEGYHQNYYEKNKGNNYCTIVIDPKIQKLYKEFGDIAK